jgi:hypothetical protein
MAIVSPPLRLTRLVALAFGREGQPPTAVTPTTRLPVEPHVAAETVAEYSEGVRVDVTEASVAYEIPALGPSRRVRLCSTVRSRIRWGTSNAVQAGVAGHSLPVPAEAAETVKVPLGATHYAVIREGATSGHIDLHPAVG